MATAAIGYDTQNRREAYFGLNQWSWLATGTVTGDLGDAPAGVGH